MHRRQRGRVAIRICKACPHLPDASMSWSHVLAVQSGENFLAGRVISRVHQFLSAHQAGMNVTFPCDGSQLVGHRKIWQGIVNFLIHGQCRGRLACFQECLGLRKSTHLSIQKRRPMLNLALRNAHNRISCRPQWHHTCSYQHQANYEGGETCQRQWRGEQTTHLQEGKSNYSS